MYHSENNYNSAKSCVFHMKILLKIKVGITVFHVKIMRYVFSLQIPIIDMKFDTWLSCQFHINLLLRRCRKHKIDSVKKSNLHSLYTVY